MSIRLILLGFLHEQPLYGYQIKQLIEQRMGDWTDIKFGSIYFSLDKLARDGFIDRQEGISDGKRPNKNVYTINEKGESEFLRLIKQQWNEMKRDFYNFDLAIYSMPFMEKEEVKTLLEERIQWHEQGLHFLDEHENEVALDSHFPPHGHAIIDHTRIHKKAEKAWLEGILKNLDLYY